MLILKLTGYLFSASKVLTKVPLWLSEIRILNVSINGLHDDNLINEKLWYQ